MTDVIIQEALHNQTIIDKAVGKGFNRSVMLVSALILILVNFTPVWAWDGAGTAADPYHIRNSADWATMATEVNAGHVADGTAFRLMGDISIKDPVGTSDHRFNGTFDGGGHTITATLSATSGRTAPFAYVNSATISHLHVKGTIRGGRHTSGITASVSGTGNTITDCRVSADITTFAEDDMIVAGGIVGHANDAYLRIEGCLFDGSISATSNVDFSYAGSIVGWCNAETSLTNLVVRNCIENGSYTNINHAGFNYADDHNASTVLTANCYTLAHDWSEVMRGHRVMSLTDGYDPDLGSVTANYTRYTTDSQ